MGTALLQLVNNLGPVHFWGLLLAAIVLTVTGFHSAFAHLSRARILEDIPTSMVRSASQGYIELQGTSRTLDGPKIFSPLSHTPCTWWEIRVEENTGSVRRRWHQVRAAVSDELFALEDDSGRCIIDPDGAEVFPMITRRWYGDSPQPAATRTRRRFGGRYRYTEKRIHDGDPLYAIGDYRTRYISDQWDTDAEVAELLREWKRDQAGLLDRFDSNRDGQLDLAEWDAVRAEALKQVRRQQQELERQPGLHVLARATDGRPFLLGALPQPDLSRRLRRKAIGGLLTFFVAGSALTLMVTLRFGF